MMIIPVSLHMLVTLAIDRYVAGFALLCRFVVRPAAKFENERRLFVQGRRGCCRRRRGRWLCASFSPRVVGGGAGMVARLVFVSFAALLLALRVLFRLRSFPNHFRSALVVLGRSFAAAACFRRAVWQSRKVRRRKRFPRLLGRAAVAGGAMSIRLYRQQLK